MQEDLLRAPVQLEESFVKPIAGHGLVAKSSLLPPDRHQLSMKEVLVHEGPRTEMVESEIPRPGSRQVGIKVKVAGINPKDWKTWWAPKPINQGNDIAGTVYALGDDVVDFQVYFPAGFPRLVDEPSLPFSSDS